MTLSYQFSGQTDTGCVREHNEDSFLVRVIETSEGNGGKGLLAIVADGVGGHVGGKRASQEGVTKIYECFQDSLEHPSGETLVGSIEAAHRHVKSISQNNPELKGMGTTCTAVWLNGSNAFVAQVGDSRAYLIRNGKPTQITEDHTLVQKLLNDGIITPSEAEDHPEKNVILQAVGFGDEVDVDLFHLPLLPEDRLLLCSDGLHGLLSDIEIAQVVSQKGLPEIVPELIDMAKSRGGHDNITAVTVFVGEGDPTTMSDKDIVGDTGEMEATRPFQALPYRSPHRSLRILLLTVLGVIAFIFLYLMDVGYFKEQSVEENSIGVAEPIKPKTPSASSSP